MPITGKLDGTGQTDGMLARVNSFREEPGGSGRVFVHDLNGPLYILDKKTKALTTYLNFNGRDNKPGLFRKLAWEVGFANGLVTFQFDPEYLSNGRFYTVHIEEPTVEASAVPDNTNVPAFKATGYTVTAADRHAGTDHERRRADRVDRHESVEHDVRRHRARIAAPAVERAHSPARRRRLQSRRAPRRSRLARDVCRRAATAAPASRRGPTRAATRSGSTRSSARSSASSRASTITRRRAR